MVGKYKWNAWNDLANMSQVSYHNKAVGHLQLESFTHPHTIFKAFRIKNIVWHIFFGPRSPAKSNRFGTAAMSINDIAEITVDILT